jgi:hypothetical protein
MEPDSYHTIFLFFDKPPKAKTGTCFNIEVIQINTETKETIGGISTRVELVPELKKAGVKAVGREIKMESLEVTSID